MARNFILVTVVTVAVVFLSGPVGVAQGQSPATDTQAAGDSLPESNPPVVRDSFDDNMKGKIWRLYQEDPNSAWVKEVNKRLEFEALADANGAFAGYISDKWWMDPNHDFSMKLDLHYDVVTYESGWLSFGLTPNPENPRDQYISVGIGCANRGPTYWHEWRDGYEIRWDFESRPFEDVTLYISYNAFKDELYVSDAGYGPDSAWHTFPDFIMERWGRTPLYVFLGGTASGPKITSGHAFVDNFVIESGVLAKPPGQNEPNNPNNPNDPNDPNTILEPDVLADVLVVPSVLRRRELGDPITVFVQLPKNIRLADVNETEPLLLRPGNALATKQVAFVWLTNKVLVRASFNRTKLMETIPTNGSIKLQVLGRLKDGRYFGGSDMVTLK